MPKTKQAALTQTGAVKKVKNLFGELITELKLNKFRCWQNDAERFVVACDSVHLNFDKIQVEFSHNNSFEVRLIKAGIAAPYAVLFPFESNFLEAVKRYI